MIEHDYSGISWQLGTPRECINSSGFFFFFSSLENELVEIQLLIFNNLYKFSLPSKFMFLMGL